MMQTDDSVPHDGDRLPVLTAREQVRVGKVYAQRFTHDSELSKKEHKERLVAISRELYPNKRYPGIKPEPDLVHTNGPESYEYTGADGRIWTVAVCGICGHKTRRPKPTAGDIEPA